MRIISHKDDNKLIQAAAGERLIVELRGSPSTGYEWTLEEIAGDSVKVDGEPVFILNEEPRAGAGPSKNDEQVMLGGPGTYRFILRALRMGESRVVFRYARAWDPTDDPSEFRLRILVGDSL